MTPRGEPRAHKFTMMMTEAERAMLDTVASASQRTAADWIRVAVREASATIAREEKTPWRFRVRLEGSLLHARVALYGSRDGVDQVAIRPGAAVLSPAHRAAASELLRLGLRADPTGDVFECAGETALDFWGKGLAGLPDDWDLFVPEELVTHPPIPEGVQLEDVQVHLTKLRALLRQRPKKLTRSSK